MRTILKFVRIAYINADEKYVKKKRFIISFMYYHFWIGLLRTLKKIYIMIIRFVYIFYNLKIFIKDLEI